MPIWQKSWSLEDINERIKGTMCEHVGLEVTAVGEDSITARMPVDERTIQHMGIIHGGASVVLAETVGSIAANMCCPHDAYAVGLEINANHLKAGRPPYVTGVATPVHVGTTTSVWDIRIHDADGNPVCISRLTAAVLKKRAEQPTRQMPHQAQEQSQQ